ncbi:MAG: hypothetical protein JW737_02855 [Acidobacteria bacterium]|nr:hypothetical protein [Acidobacteriota bacterium]
MSTHDKKFGYRVAVFDPTSIYGKEIRKILIERNFPSETVALLDTKENKGTLSEYDGEVLVLDVADRDSLATMDVIFFCGKPETVKTLAPLYKELSFYAFDLTESSPESDTYRKFVHGIDTEELKKFKGIYANPHSVTITLAHVLAHLDNEYGVERAASTVLTSVSEDGFDGISSLHKQTADLLNFVSVEGKQRIFNVYPKEDVGGSYSMKICDQVSKITGIDHSAISVVVFDAPIFFGNLISTYIELRESPGKDVDWNKIFGNLDGLQFDGVISEGSLPIGPIDIADSDNIHLQISRAEENDFKRFWLWILADNIRIGSALNAVCLAEIVLDLE